MLIDTEATSSARARRPRERRAVAVTLLLAAVALLAPERPVLAHKRDFIWSYDWFTPAQDERELETWYTYQTDQATSQLQVEFETGLTPRWSLGAYALFEGSDTRHYGWNGFKVESRYRLGSFAYNRVLHAAYFEVKKEDSAPFELEGKWLLSLYTPEDSFALNLIVEQALATGAGTEFAFTTGWTRQLGPWRAGIEAKGNFTQDKYFAGPTFGYDFGPTSRLLFGAAAGLSTASSDVLARAIYEHEFY